MSNIQKGEELTTSEVELVAGLNSLAISGVNEGIAKISATTFENRTFGTSGGGTWGSITGTLSNQTDLQSALDAKQATLVSGTNIKTINSTSLLGSGDIAISASPGGSDTQVQFNDGGVFGGDSAFTWNKTNNVMTLTVSSDNPPLQIITGGSNLVDVGAIKLWSAADNSTEKLLSAGDGVTFDENVAIYASGYIDVVPEGTVAYDAHVLKKNTVGFNAGRAGTAELSGSVTGLFSSAQSVSDGRIFGFWANMGTQDGGGMLIQGTGGAGTSEIGKHLVVWGNTAANANKAISIGNGTSFTEQAYILNNGNASFSGEVTLANTGLHLLDSNASHDLIIKPGSNLTADKTLTLTTGDADVILDLTAVTDEYVLAYDTGTNTWRGVASSGGVTFGTDNQIPFTNAGGTDFDYSANLTFNGTALALTGNQTISQGTITTDVKALDVSSTWNNGAVAFTGIKLNATQTASAAASLLLDLQRDSTSVFKVAKNGAVTIDPGSGFGSGSGNPVLTLRAMYGTASFYGTASSALAITGNFQVDGTLLLAGGISFQATGQTVDLNSGNITNLNQITNNGSLSFIKMYHDYNGAAAQASQGIIMRYANRSAGTYPRAAFQVYNSSDSTEIPFLVSSQGFAWLRNSKTDEVAYTIKGATSQTANLQNWIDSSDAVLASVAADGNISVPDEAYGSGWNGSTEVPTKNAVYDKIETLLPLSGGTLTGNITLGENTAIAYDPSLSADGKYCGDTVTGTAGTTLAFGDLVYLAAADSRWELVDADAVGTAGTVLIGMCVLAAAADGDATNILLRGFIRADTAFPALTISGPVYAGETAGDVQTTIPTGADAVIRVVGFALTADSMYFNPSQDHQTVVA